MKIKTTRYYWWAKSFLLKTLWNKKKAKYNLKYKSQHKLKINDKGPNQKSNLISSDWKEKYNKKEICINKIIKF